MFSMTLTNGFKLRRNLMRLLTSCIGRGRHLRDARWYCVKAYHRLGRKFGKSFALHFVYITAFQQITDGMFQIEEVVLSWYRLNWQWSIVRSSETIDQRKMRESLSENELGQVVLLWPRFKLCTESRSRQWEINPQVYIWKWVTDFAEKKQFDLWWDKSSFCVPAKCFHI